MWKNVVSRVIAGLGGWSIAVLATVAQPPDPKPMTTSIKGRFHSFRGDVVRVVVDENQGWQLRVTKNAVVVVKGQGGAEILKPGMPVRFYANLTRKGRAVEPIKRIEIFTPEDGLQPVILEEPEESAAEGQGSTPQAADSGESPAAEETQEDDQPEAEAEAETKEPPPVPSESAQKRPRRERTRPDLPTRRFFVVGTLASLKKGKFVVAVGRQRVQGQLAEDAVVEIESNDFRIARPGDTVEANGVRYFQPGQGQTNELKVTLHIEPAAEKPR